MVAEQAPSMALSGMAWVGSACKVSASSPGPRCNARERRWPSFQQLPK